MVVAMTMTTAVVANPDRKSADTKRSVSYEIEKMLDKSNLIVEDDFMLRIVFSISDDREIQVRSINSDNEEVNEFLMRRLENQKVYGKSWVAGKIYSLPVKVEAAR